MLTNVIGAVSFHLLASRASVMLLTLVQRFFHFRLRLSNIQCSGSMTFWCGSGSADPCLRLMDPEPAIFVIDLQDANKKLIVKKSFSAYYFLKVHLHHFSKIKSPNEVTKQ